MRRLTPIKLICTAAVAGVLCRATPVLACAACFGRSDSKLAEGMNWGIFSLLFVVVGVLASIASFFVFVARRSALSAGLPEQPLPEAQTPPNSDKA